MNLSRPTLLIYRIITAWALVALLSGTAESQKLVSVEYKSSISKGTFQAVIGTFSTDIKAKYGADLYKVTYETTGSDSRKDTASGLFILPDNIEGPLPILNYQHGTTDGRNDVPSNQSGQEFLLASLFSALGFATFAPDYIGMGESRGFHPYVNAATEASAMVDMLYAVKEYMNQTEVPFTDQLFVTGYSQGGHAAMSAHKMIEEQLNDPTVKVTAALPMSGPYSVSGVMRDLSLGSKEFFFPAYLVYTVIGAKAVEPDLYNDISNIFRPEFLSVIRPFEKTGLGLFTLNRELLFILESEFGASVPKFLFNESIVTSLATDSTSLFNQVLQSNDVYNWKPEAPVYMLYCESDDQVPFMNSLVADSVMNTLGATDVSSKDVSNGRNLSHSDCILPALIEGIPWLLSFIDNTTPTVQLTTESDLISVYPNPSVDQLYIHTNNMSVDQIAIYDMNGRLVLTQSKNSTENRVDISRLHQGWYIIKIQTDKGVYSEKIMKLSN